MVKFKNYIVLISLLLLNLKEIANKTKRLNFEVLKHQIKL